MRLSRIWRILQVEESVIHLVLVPCDPSFEKSWLRPWGNRDSSKLIHFFITITVMKVFSFVCVHLTIFNSNLETF